MKDELGSDLRWMLALSSITWKHKIDHEYLLFMEDNIKLVTFQNALIDLEGAVVQFHPTS